MIYNEITDILHVVDSFEKATISREAWGHSEHMIVALHYLLHHDPPAAKAKMRDGIINLLTSGFGIDLTKEMPYHETLTMFWMRTVHDFIETKNGGTMLEIANELVAKFDKDHPLKFYSRDRLFSDEARAEFVEADLI